MSDLVARLREDANEWDGSTYNGGLRSQALLREAADALEAAEAALENYRKRDDWTYRGRALAAEARAEKAERLLNRARGYLDEDEPELQPLIADIDARQQNPDSAERVERIRRVISLTESRNNAPVVCADHPFLVEDLKWLTDRTFSYRKEGE